MNFVCTIRKVVGSAALYPITSVYVSAVVLFWCAVMRWLSVPAALVLLGVVAATAIGWAAYREARTVHRLIDGQRAELLERIDELSAMLTMSGLAVPAPGRKEQEARDDTRRRQSQEAARV